MRRHLFVGPSLPDAVRLVGKSEVEIHPPVAAGDLLRLPLARGDTVGIIDGYFHGTRAVPHKEILAVVAAGVRVLGAASIGALRAAELDRHGVRGIGQIYTDYRFGRLDADDEVALLHGPAESGYRAMSVPLVNIRATLREATTAGLLSERVSQSVVATLAAMPYRLRTYAEVDRLVRGSDVTEQNADTLADFCADNAVDVKRTDAVQLISALCADIERPEPTSPPLSTTAHLHHWQLQAQTQEGISDISVLRAIQLFANDYPQVYREVVLGWIADECHRECGTDGASMTATAIAHGRHRGFYGDLTHEPHRRFMHDWLTPAEARNLTISDQATTTLVRSFRVLPGIGHDDLLLTALRPTRAFADARQIARNAQRLNQDVQQRAPSATPALPAGKVLAWCVRHWNVAHGDLDYAALDRGFNSLATLLTTARTYYLLASRDNIAQLHIGHLAPMDVAGTDGSRDVVEITSVSPGE